MSLYEDDAWDLYGLLREAYLTVTRAIELDTATPGLSDQLQDLMVRLARTPGNRLRPSDISRATGSTPSSTTRLLDEAERRAIITRVADPTDRRVLHAELTPSGKTMTDEWAQRALAATKAHVNDHLSPTEASQFEAILRRLRSNAQANLTDASGSATTANRSHL